MNTLYEVLEKELDMELGIRGPIKQIAVWVEIENEFTGPNERGMIWTFNFVDISLKQAYRKWVDLETFK